MWHSSVVVLPTACPVQGLPVEDPRREDGIGIIGRVPGPGAPYPKGIPT